MFATPRMSRGTQAHRRGEGGAVAVEFALILPLLGMLLLGIITFGLTYSNHLALTNTVREGARLGATAANTAAWGSSVRDRTVDLYGDATNPLPTANVCALLIQKTAAATTVLESSDAACAAGSTAAGAVPATPTSIPDDACFVKVWAEMPAKLSWLLASSDITLRAESVSAYDRTQDCT
jgi:Flp pilus assembly protein TadG